MKIVIELLPLKGALIGDQPVNFGDNKASVLAVFKGSKEDESETLYLDDYELSISFEDDKVSFIECLYGSKSERTIPTIKGCPVFQRPAEEVLVLLAELNQSEGEFDEETGYGFLAISVGCYRPSTPEDIQEEIELMKKDGSYEDNQDWLAEDLSLSRYFQTVGIGREGYYQELI